MSTPIRHTVQCRCILSQFQASADVNLHSFIVFSVMDEDKNLIPKFAKCNNCGIIHKIVDVNRSEILKKEESAAILEIEDIKPSIPDVVCSILEKCDVDLPTWEHVKWIYDEQKWGSFVVLTKEYEGTEIHGKILKILGTTLYKLDTYSRETSF